MPKRQIIFYGLAWLFCAIFSVGGFAAAYFLRWELGPLGVAGVIVFALCVFAFVPLGAAAHSSGKWYSLSALQPTLEQGPDGHVRWETIPRHRLLPYILFAIIGAGCSVVAFSGVIDSGYRAAAMPVYGTIAGVVAVGLTVMTVCHRTVCELDGETFTWRCRDLPFLWWVKDVHPVTEIQFWEIADPLPKGCRMTVHGNAETTWQLFGKTVSHTKSSQTTVEVPYFRNATPEQVKDFLQHAHFPR